MKKVALIFLSAVFLGGCATYKFHHGKEPYNKGYVVSRDDYTILEYTLGKDNSVPNLSLAKQRFKRRRDIVEDYYKRMGFIENHFKMAVLDPWIYFWKLAGGVFRLPFIAVSDYRAAHNAAYKEKLRKIEEGKDAREEAHISKLKGQLNAYIERDLSKEAPLLAAATEAVISPEPAKQVTEENKPLVTEQAAPSEVKNTASSETPVTEREEKPLSAAVRQKAVKQKITASPQVVKSATSPQGPVAVIIAKPTRGFSPLKVKFYGTKSYVPKGRIVAYAWDFGDGDASTRPNPTNTYYSASFQPQYFKVTLTVQDEKGNTAEVTTSIEVLNK